MICKNCNHENIEGAVFCSNCGHKLEEVAEIEVQTEEPVVEEVVEETIVTEEKPEETEWYYVANNTSTGPFKESEMVRLIETGTIKGSTYVWKNGMEDWIMLKDSSLAQYLKADQKTAEQPYTYTRTISSTRVAERSIVLSVILSLVTCGIYEWVWLYLEAKDINDLLANENKPIGTDPILVILLSIVTCGLYQIYFFYKAGKYLSQVGQNSMVTDDSTLLALLGFFAPIVSIAIIQNSINTISKNAQ